MNIINPKVSLFFLSIFPLFLVGWIVFCFRKKIMAVEFMAQIYLGILGGLLVFLLQLTLLKLLSFNPLIFLGLGWNFLFISGTSLLVLSYRDEEKFKAQGFNDLIVYTVQAIASLSAGVFISLTSWKTMNLVCIIFLIIIIISTLRADLSKKKPQ